MNAAPDLAIRLRRAEFNRALRDSDLAAIGPILASNAILITGSDSAIIAGRKAQLIAWKREFAAKEPTVYIRTPSEIVASSVEPIALEHGRWQGMDPSTRKARASGLYTAKWRSNGAE
ncbi:MAG: DUF4440 domain-containing protein [Novosphingobium sp. 12-63-9]|nr:MAG: DUF4440 domain-containing protein [Novosphingobium sp. 12-63-9]